MPSFHQLDTPSSRPIGSFCQLSQSMCGLEWTNPSKRGKTRVFLLLYEPETKGTNQPRTCGSGDIWSVWWWGCVFSVVTHRQQTPYPISEPLGNKGRKPWTVNPGAGESPRGIPPLRVAFPDCNREKGGMGLGLGVWAPADQLLLCRFSSVIFCNAGLFVSLCFSLCSSDGLGF